MMITRKAKRKIKSFLVLIFLGFICLYFVTHYFLYKGVKKETMISPFVPSSPSVIPKPASLEQSVQTALEGTKGTYSVAIKNLKNRETYYLKEHQVFDAGSLYKLWIMAEVYKQIQDGDLKEDEVLSEDVPVLNDKFKLSPDVAELTDGTITLSVNDALNQMITISHNYAALLLTEKVKLSSIALFLKNNGFPNLGLVQVRIIPQQLLGILLSFLKNYTKENLPIRRIQIKC